MLLAFVDDAHGSSAAALPAPCESVLQDLSEYLPTPGRRTARALLRLALSHGWRASVATPAADGALPGCGPRLCALDLDADGRRALRAQVEQLFVRPGDARLPARVAEARARVLGDLKAFIASRAPFEIILDAANLGFFHQNFEGGHFSYAQIHACLEALWARGFRRILVVIHERWTRDDANLAVHRSAGYVASKRELKRLEAPVTAGVADVVVAAESAPAPSIEG